MNQDSNTPVSADPTQPRSRPGLARVLRGLAGAPAAWSQSRRGSFLVLVVGTLALLAVIAIVYVTIGNQDVRMKAAVDQRSSLDKLPTQVADYIVSVISDDVFSTTVNTIPGPGGNLLVFSRESTDYPTTSWDVFSNITDPTNPGFFTVTGTGGPEPSDPWLASSTPSFINFAGVNNTSPDQPYLDNRDWLHITNIAPDGRAVNLVNLRNNFKATPVQLRTNLTLLDDQGRPTPTTDFGVAANTLADRPATWFSRQRGAFRPVGTSGINPDQPAYPPYQWADADGDGMYDSRLVELIDARNVNGITSILETDGRFRYFVAARIEDLSSRINVNTAGDGARPVPAVATGGTPGSPIPPGLTPADVDLFRLLSQQDQFDPVPNSYNNIPARLVVPPTPNDYSAFDQRIALDSGNEAYRSLRMSIFTGGELPNPDVETLDDYAARVGLPNQWSLRADVYDRARYIKVRRENLEGSVPNYTTPNLLIETYAAFGNDDLSELLTYRVANDPAITSKLELTLDGRSRLLPNSRNYGPLRSNRTLDVELLRYAGNTPLTPAFVAGDPVYNATMTLFSSDVRQHLTTLSGSRELRPTIIAPGSADELTTRELKFDLGRIIDQATATNATPTSFTAAVNLLFRGYADALAPFSAVPGSFEPARTDLLTAAYGGKGAEAALVAAAHATVNFLDLVDTDTRPNVLTVLIDSGFAAQLAADSALPIATRQFPDWADPISTPTGTRLAANAARPLDLRTAGVDRLAPVGADIKAPAVTVYGIEPQPFITQVAAFTVYTDAPVAAGGDDELGGPPPGGGAGPPITISGAISSSNNDLLYQVIAFQLTNPFNVPIELSDGFGTTEYFEAADPAMPRADQEKDYYYIEYGGYTYKLVALEDPTFVDSATAADLNAQGFPAYEDPILFGVGYVNATSPGTRLAGGEDVVSRKITIRPGESIVCYTISQTPRGIMERLETKSYDTALFNVPGVNGAYPTAKLGQLRNTIENIIEESLGGISKAYWVPRISATTGRLELPPRDSFAPVTAVGGDLSEVRLKRVLRFDTEAAALPPVTVPTFWDGSGNGAAATRSTEVVEINIPGNDQLVDRFRVPDAGNFIPTLGTASSNIGSTDSTVDDTGYTITLWSARTRRANPTSAIPFGAIPGYCIEPKYVTTSWNEQVDDTFGASVSRSDFGGGANVARRNMRDWLTRMVSGGVDSPIKKGPEDLSGSTIPNPTIPAPDPNIASPNYTAYYPNIVFSETGLRTALPDPGTPSVSLARLTDLLLPLGLGPQKTPELPRGQVPDPAQVETTLAEALAIALGYENLSDPLAATDPAIAYMSPVTVTAPSGNKAMFDRGHLRIDDFALFLDNDGDGVFNDINGDNIPDTPAGPDVRLGLGMPAALAILDQFTPRSFSTIYGQANLREATQGTINIQTAPVEVLRMVPMLSPPPRQAQVPGNIVEGTDNWWWGGSTTVPVNSTSDVAPALVALRDKVPTPVRPAAQQYNRAGSSITGYAVQGGIDFRDINLVPPFNTPDLNGRSTWTGILGLAETPGLRGVGALLTTRYLFFDGTAIRRDLPVSIDRLGFDVTPGGQLLDSTFPGMDSIIDLPVTPPTPPPTVFIANEFKEKLPIAAGALSSLTASSDYYAVWFLIQGFQASDVQNLKPTEPMVPSISRRFVMVVDRSNVVRKGDKAKVVLFREVPVELPRQ